MSVYTISYTLLHTYMFQSSARREYWYISWAGQQNTCPGVNIRLKSSVLYVTQQCVHGAVHDREHTQTSRLPKLLCTYPSQYSNTHELATIVLTENDRRVGRLFSPYPTAFPYGNGMVLHFYQQQESSTTKTVHKVINKGLKTYV